MTFQPENANGQRKNQTEVKSYKDSKRNHDFNLFSKALKLTRGNKQGAANLLKIDRKTFYSKLKKLGL